MSVTIALVQIWIGLCALMFMCSPFPGLDGLAQWLAFPIILLPVLAVPVFILELLGAFNGLRKL